MVNMINKTISATKAKMLFGELIDEARISPVSVTKNNKIVAVMMSASEYERLQSLDTAYWANKALQAKEGGFVGKKKSGELINDLLHA